MYYKKSISNMSWSEAFASVERSVTQAELTQQVINHLADYPGESHGEYVKLSKEKQDDLYEILGDIL